MKIWNMNMLNVSTTLTSLNTTCECKTICNLDDGSIFALNLLHHLVDHNPNQPALLSQQELWCFAFHVVVVLLVA